MNIGKSVVIKGELSGSEDLTIEGHVEGRIELRENVLTIGPNGKIKAQVFAKSVIVLGEVRATSRPRRRSTSATTARWTVTSRPRVAIAEGAHFRGSIDMQRAGASAKPTEKKEGRSPAVAAGKASPPSSTAGS